MHALFVIALAAATGHVSGRVIVSKNGSPKADQSNVVVYLDGVKDAPKLKPTTGSEVRQRDLQFEPAINVIVVGSSIDFPNEDKVFHNVFSVSEASKFDLGLYRSGDRKTVTFKKPGVVDVYCNIHPEMVAKIKVLDTMLYAITDKSGAFTIKDVPLGKHRVVAWQAYGEEATGETIVDGTERAPIELKLEEGTKKRHLRKDGTPYGRYK